MNILFLGIVAFLIVLSIFDLVVGVSNDAVNFLNSAIGARVAKFKVIVLVAAIGIFAGAATSNGMMDVARHGIMTPAYFSFYDVICVFLAVMVTDIILLDTFNTLGMPTSTTVSMVFELLGGAFAIAIIKIAQGMTGSHGVVLTFGDLLNTEKALTCIISIFLSVAIAFLSGTLVMWGTRLILTFNHNRFISFTARGIVLLGTGLLAFSFASNDLVNFVGVPLTGLDAYCDFTNNGAPEASSFMMTSLMESAHTPSIDLIIAGGIMVCALVFSKKAQNVVKTSVNLARQDEGDEMFGSNAVARIMVRHSQKLAETVTDFLPSRITRWIDARFNSDTATLPPGAAFDYVRAAVNLLLAGFLLIIATRMKLPLSTTYVTFMVAMGTSLADRAWSRESAVFRITGVLSVIGGWFITAGAAFITCYLITNILFFGSLPAMIFAIIGAITLLIHSNTRFKQRDNSSGTDLLFKKILRTSDKAECWQILKEYVNQTSYQELQAAAENYEMLTTAFFQEEYKMLKRTSHHIEDQHKDIKRQRRKHIISLRRIAPIQSIEKGTWYFLVSSSLTQMVYCLKRMSDPCREHVGNNFSPVPSHYANEFLIYRDEIIFLFKRAYVSHQAQEIRNDASKIQSALSDYRKRIIIDIQKHQLNIESMTVFLNMVQESQELLSTLRHTMRGISKFEE